MSAGDEMQAAVIAALQPVAMLTGIYDGPPSRAEYPYAVVDGGIESDWGHKSGEGRELLLAVTLWDDQPVRLAELSDRAEAAVLNCGPTLDWQLVSLRLLRRSRLRDPLGPWATAMDFRARLLAR